MNTVITKYSNAATWTAVNPILGEQFVGYERDTGKKKIGDGFNRWNDLPYRNYSLLTDAPVEKELTTDNDEEKELFSFDIPPGRVARIKYECMAIGNMGTALDAAGRISWLSDEGALTQLNSSTQFESTSAAILNINIGDSGVSFSVEGVDGEIINWISSFEGLYVESPASSESES